METIAAISTPIGSGGIGIIRISGDKAIEIINKVFVPFKKGEFKPFAMRLGNIINEDKDVIDQVLVSYFKAPKSYTGEDVCEINCHGGNVSIQRILEIVLQNGAVLATGGEFTKRAFLNGKLDLTQAEAVADIINSKSERENKNSLKQLQGRLGEEIKSIKDEIINLLSDIEANIDYPEYEDIEDVRRERINKTILTQIAKLKTLEDTFENGKILKDGILTTIIGKPNVGKSSLLNILVKEERAIVTDIPGTTRDTIEECINLKGITLRIVDTAGIRKTDDLVENIGVEKSKKMISEAELILFIIDASEKITEEELELYDTIKTKPHIIIKNKIDLEDVNKNTFDEQTIDISAKKYTGIDRLEDRIIEIFNLQKLENENDMIVTNIRHKDLIKKAIERLEKTMQDVSIGIPVDMVSINIQDAIASLAEITGESVNESVLNKIFEKFCVGK